jgi:hypothetical protein
MAPFSGQFSDEVFLVEKFFIKFIGNYLLMRFFLIRKWYSSSFETQSIERNFSIKFVISNEKNLIKKSKFKILKTKRNENSRIYGKHNRNRTYFCSNTRRLHYIKEIQIKSGIYREHFIKIWRGLKSVIIYVFFLGFCLWKLLQLLLESIETNCCRKIIIFFIKIRRGGKKNSSFK